MDLIANCKITIPRAVVQGLEEMARKATKKAEEAAKRAEKMAEEDAKKAQKMAEEAEKIAKKVADDTEEFVRNKLPPGFRHLYGHFDSHQGHGRAPATAIYHHYHHGKATATETSTTAVASTFVATPFITETRLYFPGPTTASTARALGNAAINGLLFQLSHQGSGFNSAINNAATTDVPIGEYFGYVASIRFWVIAFLLFINAIVVKILMNPDKKSSTRPKPHAPSLGGTELDLTCLKPCITTRSRQIFAIVLCRIFIGLYLLESYWVLDTVLRIFWIHLRKAMGESNHWFFILLMLLAILHLVLMGGILGSGLCLALDQQFTLDGELVMLEVPVDACCGPVRNGVKSRHGAHGGRGHVGADTWSMESESEGHL